MKQRSHQLGAMLAITKASLKALLRSPSAIVFSVLFPLIFILVFGFIGGGGRMTFKVGFHPQSDTTSLVHLVLRDSVGLQIVTKPLAELEEDLEKGRITAILNVIPSDSTGGAPYSIDLKS
ncbi:MAG: ABC transporter permease, partial [Bacteroidota bacterium]